MTGQEIADLLGTSRHNISNILKRAMKKVYNGVREMEIDPKFGPFESMVVMYLILKPEDDDLEKFFRLFPRKIRDEIRNDARLLYR